MVIFFSKIWKSGGVDEYYKTQKKFETGKRKIEFKDRFSVSFSDGSKIEYNHSANSSYSPYYRFIRKKDKNKKETPSKMLLYLYNKPVKKKVDTSKERNFDYDKEYYFKKVESMAVEYLIPLEDDTFLVASHGPESIVIIRFDKEFNTKSELIGKNIFIIDEKVTEDIYSKIGIYDASRDEALYEYILKIKEEK